MSMTRRSDEAQGPWQVNRPGRVKNVQRPRPSARERNLPPLTLFSFFTPSETARLASRVYECVYSRRNARMRARARALSRVRSYMCIHVHTITRINALAHGRTSNPSSFAYLSAPRCESVRSVRQPTVHTSHPHTPLTDAPSTATIIERIARNQRNTKRAVTHKRVQTRRHTRATRSERQLSRQVSHRCFSVNVGDIVHALC